MICLLNTSEDVGGWRLRWLTRPMPRDPESGEGSEAMTGACLTVSQLQSIPWAAAPHLHRCCWRLRCLSRRLSLGECRKALYEWAAAAVGAPVSFREKRTGAGWRNEMAKRIGCCGQL